MLHNEGHMNIKGFTAYICGQYKSRNHVMQQFTSEIRICTDIVLNNINRHLDKHMNTEILLQHSTHRG